MVEETPTAQHEERIAQLEEQTRELNRQVSGLLKREKRRQRSTKSLDVRSALSGRLMKKTFGVLLLVSLLPVFGPVFVDVFRPTYADPNILFPPELFTLFPGGKVVWIPIWQTSIFLTFVAGAVAFVASRD